MQKKWKQLLACLAAPLAAGGLSAWLSRKGMKAFGTLLSRRCLHRRDCSRWSGRSFSC